MAEVEQALIAGDQPPVVICLSEYVARDLHAFYPTARTATLFNAVNLQTFDPARRPTAGAEIRERFGLKRDDTIALMIAQDFERKGLRQSIEALAQLPDLRLLVVGQGKTAPYKRQAERLKVRDRITFAGSTDDPHAFYAASDFFILPTRHDPCSLVVLEALAMGLPVISTVFNGATEIMENGLHGFILSSADDMPALARAMQDCCDASRRQIMSQACLALRPKLSYETHLDTLEAIYHRQQARK
jgi:UDP-glucose:(heptosyl)LPS alpha-1,3-glucosyltransferase